MSWGEAQPRYESDQPYGQPPQPPTQPFPGPQGPQGAQGPQSPGQHYPPQQYPETQPYPQQQYPQQQQFGWASTPPQQQPGGPYAQPGYPPSDFTGYPDPAPKEGNGVLIGIVVGALVVVGGGITAALLLTGKHGGGTASADGSAGTGHATTSAAAVALTAPSGVKGLTKLTGAVADDAVSGMRQSLSAEASEYPDPVLAAYDDHGGGGVTTILVDEPMDRLSSADQAQLTALGSASDIVSSIMSAAGVESPQSETTSSGDGALSCGAKDESGTDVTICVWYDQTTFGSLQYLDGTSPSAAAPVADAVRAAAER
jgi:hypothetical protein